MENSNKKLPLLFKVEDYLGPLEREVMLVIWELGKANVRQVLRTLRRKKKFAYTTIMTVMNRLYRKKFLKREKMGKAYYYFPAIEEKIIIANSLSFVFRDLAKNYGRKKVALATLSLMPSFSNKLIKTYRQPVLLSFSFGLIFLLAAYSLFDLYQNFSFFGVIDYLKILPLSVTNNSYHWRLFFLALKERLPLINIATTVILLILVVIFAKKLIRLREVK